MFKNFFGETDEQQLQYLQGRVIISIASLVLMFVGGSGSIGANIFVLIMMFVWGLGAVKSLFGIATIGALFSRNIVFGVVIFVVYVMIAYLAGIFCAALGVGRYIYLLIKKRKGRN